MEQAKKGGALVVRPDEGESFWQPVPANGYSEARVGRHNLDSDPGFSTGIQMVAPHSYIREHCHDAHEEILFIYEDRGQVIVEGVAHEVVPGTTIYAGPNILHKIVNDSDDELKLMWTLMPGGLEDFFEAVGRSRKPGEPAPEPFARPENVLEIETDTVFAPGSEKV